MSTANELSASRNTEASRAVAEARKRDPCLLFERASFEDSVNTGTPARPGLRVRIARFIMSPLHSKYITLALRASRLFPEMPIPLRLPFGAWWLARKGALDHELIYNGFEDM